MRVAGTDPGTSGLDVLILSAGQVHDQTSFSPEQLRANPTAPIDWLSERGPFEVVAGPSGYGLPLVRANACGERELALMSLVRPDERNARGVAGFSAVVQAFASSSLPVVFLPGVVHLSTVPPYRKQNRIDMGTPDKLSVAVLALVMRCSQLGIALDEYSACIVELGSAFSACLVLDKGRIVDGLGGTAGPMGWRSLGCWDGELAYLLSPLTKADLFEGGATSGEVQAFQESLIRSVAGLLSLHDCSEIVLSGALLEREAAIASQIEQQLSKLGSVARLGALPGTTVKHAAQGAALIADGLAGGEHRQLVETLRLREATGTVLDHLTHPRAAKVQLIGNG